VALSRKYRLNAIDSQIEGRMAQLSFHDSPEVEGFALSFFADPETKSQICIQFQDFKEQPSLIATIRMKRAEVGILIAQLAVLLSDDRPSG
jgi:hypothetical protein